MKPTRNVLLTALTLATLSAGSWAQTSAPAAQPQPVVTPADIQALKDALAAQQQQIQALQEELHRKNQVAAQAQSAAADASAKADAEQAQSSQPQSVSQVEDDFAALTSVNHASANSATLQNAVLSLQDSTQKPDQDEPQTFNQQMEGPLTIHFRGINITPGGYAAAEFVRRSKALGADVQTPFNSVPVPGASQSSVSEFFGSGRQSKITAYVDGRMKNVSLSSYVSADFLSAGVTSNSNSTNGYTLRLRQAWGQAKFDDGWSFVGGQEWSLLTENGAGISPDDDLGRTNDARPKTIDSSYNVGFVYTRQYGIRVAKNFGDKIAFAVALENAQGTLTTHGNGDNFLLGQPGASNSYNSTSTYTFNPSPDLIAKVAFDPGFGHYEIFGLYDRFTNRVFPCGEVTAATTFCGGSAVAGPNSIGVYNASKDGGGAGASARWAFLNKHVVFGVKGFGGSGVGRYASGGLSDLAINGNGTLHLIKNFAGLSTLELHTRKLDIYSYAGVEYAGRAVSFDPLQAAGKTAGEVGYGAPLFNNSGCYTELPPGVNTGFTPATPSNCAADTRALIEGTLGFWYRFYSGPRGRFQFGTQYSYLTRQTWSGIPAKGTSGTPQGVDNMIFTSFRYVLP